MQHISQLISQRRSHRSFQQTPVSKETVLELLRTAGASPSSSNMQPWKVYALSGASKDKLCHATMAFAMTHPTGGATDIDIYPNPLPQPWYERRRECGEKLYETLGISREDKRGRAMQAGKNLTFFGAPVGMIITIDEALCPSQLIDIGIFLQSLMLCAEEMGLATCPQASWAMWAEVVHSTLAIPSNERVIVGMALGYPNDDKINSLKQNRLAIEEFATLRGFDDVE
jgi:nitroreductase